MSDKFQEQVLSMLHQLQKDVTKIQSDVKQLQGDVKQLQEGQQFLITAVRELRDETSRTFMHQAHKNAQFESDISMLSFRLANHKHDM